MGNNKVYALLSCGMGVDCNKHLQSTVKHILFYKYTVATSQRQILKLVLQRATAASSWKASLGK
jgi:hypothetical protein